MTKRFLDDYKPTGIDDATFEPSDPNGIKQNFLLCAVGPPGSGKTHACAAYINTLDQHRDINKLYILSPTYHNNEGYFNKITIEKEICDDMKEANGFISKMKEEQLKIKEIWKQIKKEYPTLAQFETYIKQVRKNETIKKLATMRHPNFNGASPHTLEEAAKKYMEKKGLPQKLNLLAYGEYILSQIEKMKSVKAFYEKPPMALLFCDDVQGTKLMSNSKDSPFVNFLIKHRHYYTSVIFGVHSIKNGLPTTVRAQITDWMVFRVNDPKLINTIHAEAAQAEGTPEDFEKFYKDNIDGEKNRFLMINKKEKPVQGRFGWGLKGEKLSLKDMINNHKSKLQIIPEEKPLKNGTAFHFQDGTKNDRKIYVNLQNDLQPQKKKKKF